MSAARKAAIGVGAVVGIGALSVATLYLTAVLFLVINKTNPAKARPFSAIQYWKLYAADPAQRKRLKGAGAFSGGICLVVIPLLAITGAVP